MDFKTFCFHAAKECHKENHFRNRKKIETGGKRRCEQTSFCYNIQISMAIYKGHEVEIRFLLCGLAFPYYCGRGHSDNIRKHDK